MKAKFFFFVLLISLLGATQVKADTIYYQVPGNAQICQDPIEVDTFVFYHSFPSSIVNWSVSFDGGSFVPSGYGDSLLLIPTMMGNYTIVATYSGIPESFTLNLFSTPPPHADFAVLAGGEINVSKDTAWMCQGSISLASNTIGSQAPSYTWSGPGGFENSSNDPVTITSPGKYYFTRVNPCGITVDSIQVVALPTTLPMFTDTTFCNTSVEVLLDASPGFTYAWSTLETTQTIFVTSPGTYSVNLSNACISGSASVTIEHESFPLPDLLTNSQIPSAILCQNEVAILDPYPGYTYDSYQWYQIVTPVGNQSTLTVDYALGDGPYNVEVTQGNCSATSDVMVEFYVDPESPMHCVSTFDPVTGTNMTVTEVHPEPEVVDYILAYEQGVSWIGVDTVAATGLFSCTLYDNTNDPNQQSYKYTVFARHSCGHLSPVLDWHKTIMIDIFISEMSGDYVLLILDDYTTMSEYTPSSYTIWIDSLNNGNFTSIGILNGGNTSFTITSPVNGAAYYASVNLPWNCGGVKSFPEAFSNKRLFNVTEITDMSISSSISLYPNPSAGIFSVKGENISLVEVKDIRGNIVLVTTETQNIDLSAYSSGMYIVTVITEQGSTNLRITMSK